MGVRCMMGLMVSRAAATAALVRGGAVCWLDSFISSVDREFSENSAKVHTHVGRSHAGKRHSPSRDITSSLTMYAYGPVRYPPEISTSLATSSVDSEAQFAAVGRWRGTAFRVCYGKLGRGRSDKPAWAYMTERVTVT